jgi:hypothetical protein
MDGQISRYARLRYATTGALAALAAVGAIAGANALAAKSHTAAHRHVTMTSDPSTTAAIPSPVKTGPPPQPPANPQGFLNAVRHLVESGTITAAQGEALDRDIRAGRIEPDTLSGFTPTQLQAVQEALANVKRVLASSAHSTSK